MKLQNQNYDLVCKTKTKVNWMKSEDQLKACNCKTKTKTITKINQNWDLQRIQNEDQLKACRTKTKTSARHRPKPTRFWSWSCNESSLISVIRRWPVVALAVSRILRVPRRIIFLFFNSFNF